jgi:hypothetical protein
MAIIFAWSQAIIKAPLHDSNTWLSVKLNQKYMQSNQKAHMAPPDDKHIGMTPKTN